MSPIMLQNFLSVALPICVTFVATIWIAAWTQNKRLDFIALRSEMAAGFARISSQIQSLEAKLTLHEVEHHHER